MGAWILVALLCPIALLIISLVKTAIQNFFFFRQFAAKSPGLAIVKDANLIFGHSFSLFHNRHNYSRFRDLHDTYGPTYAWFYYNPMVNTTDLDLIKTITIDEPFDHLDRMDLSRLPIEELRESILFLPKDQWHKHRKAVSPAFR